MGKEKEQKMFRIDQDVASLIYFYCALNNLKVNEFVTQVLSERLNDFKEKVEQMKFK